MDKSVLTYEEFASNFFKYFKLTSLTGGRGRFKLLSLTNTILFLNLKLISLNILFLFSSYAQVNCLVKGLRLIVHKKALNLGVGCFPRGGGGSQPVFLLKFQKKKSTENSEQLARHGRPEIEPYTSHRPVLRANNAATGEMSYVQDTYL